MSFYEWLNLEGLKPLIGPLLAVVLLIGGPVFAVSWKRKPRLPVLRPHTPYYEIERTVPAYRREAK